MWTLKTAKMFLLKCLVWPVIMYGSGVRPRLSGKGKKTDCMQQKCYHIEYRRLLVEEMWLYRGLLARQMWLYRSLLTEKKNAPAKTSLGNCPPNTFYCRKSTNLMPNEALEQIWRHRHFNEESSPRCRTWTLVQRSDPGRSQAAETEMTGVQL